MMSSKRIRSALFAVCILFFGAPAVAAMNAGEPAAPEAELLLYTHDPWKTVIGSDSPRFACYTSGLMIFYSPERKAYQSIRLTPEERAGLRSEMAALDGLKDHYDLSMGRTDQPMNRIGFRRDGKLRWVSAEGGMILEMARIAVWLERLARFAGTERIQEWTPAYLEIMLWPFEHARGELPWPKEFPGLDSPLTVERRKNAYSIYLPWGEKEKFDRFRKELDGKAALLDGRKWSVDKLYVSVLFNGTNRTSAGDVVSFLHDPENPAETIMKNNLWWFGFAVSALITLIMFLTSLGAPDPDLKKPSVRSPRGRSGRLSRNHVRRCLDKIRLTGYAATHRHPMLSELIAHFSAPLPAMMRKLVRVKNL